MIKNCFQDFYSDWIFRLYFDSSKIEMESLRQLCNLSCHASLDLCPVASTPVFGDLSQVYGDLWRFLPLADQTVDVSLSRDLDSR